MDPAACLGSSTAELTLLTGGGGKPPQNGISGPVFHLPYGGVGSGDMPSPQHLWRGVGGGGEDWP